MIVKLRGSFPKAEQQNNGLNEIGEALDKDRLTRHYVVGMVEYHRKVEEAGRTPVITAALVAVEVADGDNKDVAARLLDELRKGRSLGPVEPTLLDALADLACEPDPDGGDPAPKRGRAK